MAEHRVALASLVLLLLVCLFPSWSTAQTFSLNISPRFEKCTGLAGVYDPSNAAKCTFSSNSVSWGVPETGTQRSGAQFVAKSNPAVTFNTQFDLGDLIHLNYPLEADLDAADKEHPSLVDLVLSVSGTVNGQNIQFTPRFTLSIEETLNRDERNTVTDVCIYNSPSGTPCCKYPTLSTRGPCSDRLTFPSNVNARVSFSANGVNYYLELTGFKRNGQTVEEFISDEGQNSRATLVGKIVAECANNDNCPNPPSDQPCARKTCSNGQCRFELNPDFVCPNEGPDAECSQPKCSSSSLKCDGVASPSENGIPCTADIPLPQGRILQCNKKVCMSGRCTWLSKGDGAPCTTVTEGPSTPDPVCHEQEKKCDYYGKVCSYRTVTNNNCAPDGNSCHQSKCTGGTCVKSVNVGGSCGSGGTNGCKDRKCVSKSGVGSCRTTFKLGNCNAAGVQECEEGSCAAQGSCIKVFQPGNNCDLDEPNPDWHQRCQIGTCVPQNSGGRVGSCRAELRSSLGSVSCANNNGCRRFRCNSAGSCETLARLGVSCTSEIVPRNGCTVGTCVAESGSNPSGTCRKKNYKTGHQPSSCTGSSASSCFKRECKAGSDNKGECATVYAAGGSCDNIVEPGSCQNSKCMPTSESGFNLEDPLSYCKLVDAVEGCDPGGLGECEVGACESGTCVRVNRAGHVCSLGSSFTCKRGTCRNRACIAEPRNQNQVCSETPAVDCKRRICQGTSCVNVANSAVNGNICSSPENSPGSGSQSCYATTCQSGSCLWTAKPVNSVCQAGSDADGCARSICNPSNQCVQAATTGQTCGPGAAECTRSSCQSGSCTSSPYREGESCNAPANTPGGTRPQDLQCFKDACDSGQCTREYFPIGTTCGARPDAETFCSKFGCDGNGVCRDAGEEDIIPIADGEPCFGTDQQCTFSDPTCYDECRALVCSNGQCIIDELEGPCEHIKAFTFKRQASNVTNDCSTSRCIRGVCSATEVNDGISCGRNQSEDACVDDRCVAGICIPGSRDCLAELGEPVDVCHEVVCDTSLGCIQRLSGVVDCSCVYDCETCTNLASLPNTNIECWWCPGGGSDDLPAGCYNKKITRTGQTWSTPDDNCFFSNQCLVGEKGDGELSDGEIGGIVGAVIAALALGVSLLAAAGMFMYYMMKKTPEQDVVFGERAFEDAVMDNPFFENQAKFKESLFYEGN